VAGPDADAEIPFESRRVDYAVAVPGRTGQWLMAVFSTLGNGDPDGEYARILTEFFDAIMSTFPVDLGMRKMQAAQRSPR